MGTVTLPNTITAGTPENINHVTGNMSAIVTEVNGNLDDTNMKSTFSGYAVYKHLLERYNKFQSAAATTTYVMANADVKTLPTADNGGSMVFYLDPADYTAGSRSTKYRIRASLMTNATAPAMTFTVGLYPVSAVAGGVGAMSITLGTVTAGSTVAFASQAASTRGQGNSGDFAAPTAGYYCLGVVSSALQTSNSAATIDAQLQMRQT